MSESTSRAERRALRRVAGEEVLGVVKDQHQAVVTLQASLNSHAEALTQLRTDFYGRRLLGRLRWLLIGK